LERFKLETAYLVQHVLAMTDYPWSWRGQVTRSDFTI